MLERTKCSVAFTLRLNRETRNVDWLHLPAQPLWLFPRCVGGERSEGAIGMGVSLQMVRRRWHRPHPSLPPLPGEGADQ